MPALRACLLLAFLFAGGCAGPELPAPPAGECGGMQGLACAAGQFCAYPPEARCGAADQMGSCAPRPDACIELYDPVCGCDDRTYGNGCKAASAGVSVAHEGECRDATALRTRTTQRAASSAR